VWSRCQFGVNLCKAVNEILLSLGMVYSCFHVDFESRRWKESITDVKDQNDLWVFLNSIAWVNLSQLLFQPICKPQ
jgi:hypothetical protein